MTLAQIDIDHDYLPLFMTSLYSLVFWFHNSFNGAKFCYAIKAKPCMESFWLHFYFFVAFLGHYVSLE